MNTLKNRVYNALYIMHGKEKIMGKRDYDMEAVRAQILQAAARLFLTVGYDKATVLKIADEAGLNSGSVVYAYKTKENVVCELVSYVLEGQFEFTEKFLQGKTDDKILFYAAETTLQLYMAESNEHVRKLYNVAYSLPNSSQIIYHTITSKLERIFSEMLPDWQTKDFYEREIASAGVIRNYMSVPCDMYFTMDRKVKAFIESTMLLYHVPDEKIKEAIAFVSQFDFETLAKQVIDGMLASLENKEE